MAGSMDSFTADPCLDSMAAATSALVSLFDDDDARWHALQTRNANADGFFFYGVRSTKIYCRPTCKARLARRANVTFYETPQEAQRAGFRACKRCKPELAGFMPEEAAVTKIREFVKRHQGSGHDEGMMSLGQMARRLGMSKWHFHRVFKKTVGVTPVEYARLRGKRTAGDGSQLTTTSPPGTEPLGPDLDMDWLQQLEMCSFGLDALDPLLSSGVASAGSDAASPLEESLQGCVPWAELLEDDFTAPT